MTSVTLIEGDGIGPEITDAVKKIFKEAKVPVEWEECRAGEKAVAHGEELIPQSLNKSIEKNRVALKGPVTTPVGKGFKSVNVQLRQLFDLYQNIRPCKSTPGIETKFDNVDLVIFRENTEGLYSGLEFYDERLKISDSISRITQVGCERIVRAAFDFAQQEGRKKVTLVHKANILKSGGKLFLNAGEAAAKNYPGIQFEDKIIDNMCMQLVMHPENYEVVVTTNLFGDILSDLCAGLVGGLGVVAGANVGDNTSIFEAVHGSAPDIAGKGVANPTALLRSALLMLDYLDMKSYSQKIENALFAALQEKANCTPDLGGTGNTKTFTDNIVKNL